MFIRHFILMLTVMVLLAWNAAHAKERRFFHKPVTLEARATQIDIQVDQDRHDATTIVDELGNHSQIRNADDKNHKIDRLDKDMQKWRLRNKFWGETESIQYLYRLTHGVG